MSAKIPGKKKTGRQRELAVIELPKDFDYDQFIDVIADVLGPVFRHFGVAPDDPYSLIVRMGIDAGYIRFKAQKGKPGRRARWTIRHKARLWATVQILITQHRPYAAQWGAKTAIDYIEAGIGAGKMGWPYEGWPSSTGLLSQYNRILRLPHIKVFEHFAVLPPDLWLLAMKHVAQAPGTDAESVLRDCQASLAKNEDVP